MTANKRRNF